MSVSKDNLVRISAIAGAPSVVLLPVGSTPAAERGIAGAGERWPALGKAIVQALGIAAIAVGLHSAPAVAAGVGYDANVYGQSGGQVMQQGNAIPAKVLSVRGVMIEVAPEAHRQNAAITYGVPAAAAGIGGLIGNKLGGKSSSGKQIGAVLGGVAGGLAGAVMVDAMSGPSGGQQIPGVELTVRNPITKNVAVITQAGDLQFAEGDNVLVVSMGNTVRVVPDRSREVLAHGADTFAPAPALIPSPRHDTAMELVRTANTLGLRLDPTTVAMLIEPGPVPNQMFGGKVVGVDHERGLVYQELGRGTGTVHSASKLSRVPAIGEYVKVQYSGGVGNVVGKQQTRNGAER